VTAREDRYETFAEAARHFAAQVRSISGSAWADPGLGEWDLRSLVGHTSRSLTTVELYLGQPADAEEVVSAAQYYAAVAEVVGDPGVAKRGRAAGQAMGDDPAGYVDALVARVLPLAAAAGDPLIRTFAGGMRFGTYLPTRTFELVVHGIDIADAVQAPPPPYSEELLEEAVSLAGLAAAAQGKGLQVLRALTGRSTLSAGFSVV
jgi:uncharacterized protein (TIGR03083 family)